MNRFWAGIQIAAVMFLGQMGEVVASEELYRQGRAAEEKGDLDGAYGLFKKACLAADGSAEACLAWGELAKSKGEGRDRKRALSSAVMFDPENVQARYRLAMMLLTRTDYKWAIEHLEAAIRSTQSAANESLLEYYLGYALYKNKEFDAALTHLLIAHPGLPEKLQQRAAYYIGLIEERRLARSDWAERMLETSEGPDPAWSVAATNRLSRSSAFPRRDGFSGLVITSLGINTHPASAFLDDVETESPPVLQSVFRADGVFTAGGYTHGLKASLTAYREQNWTELGEGKVPEDTTITPSPFEPADFNTTLFIGQVAYVRRAWRNDRENEFVLGVDQEVQFLDNVPKKNDAHSYDETGFGMNANAVAGKFWWTVAANPTALYAARMKVELRPSYIDEQRSSTRYRLRLLGTKHLLHRTIRMRAMVGTRYDRTYADPEVFKYDRLVPEMDLNMRIRTPYRVTAVIGGKLKYHWYMNSRGDPENSFRPPYKELEGVSDMINAAYEEGYYAETRQDFEWELNGELYVALWKRSFLALTYRHHQRLTNLDDAPKPLSQTWPDSGIWERADAPTYGYVQDVVMLEFRQGF